MPVVKKNHAGTWGAFNKYVDRILPFLSPFPLRGQFFYADQGQKQTIFDPIPPHFVHVVIEWPLGAKQWSSPRQGSSPGNVANGAK